ncbi:MAG TPA: hypothetical protein VH643_01830 [Gemmataceae bacterium]|jgi:hypothetical protein
MNDQPRPSIAELLADRDLITAAVNRAIQEAVLKHAQAGQAIAVSQNGEVVWIPPAEILADFAGDTAKKALPA